MKFFNRNCSLQKSLPVIGGRSCDKKVKINLKYKRPTLSRNLSSNLRNRLANFSLDEKNLTLNVKKLNPIEESKNERYEECDILKEIVENKKDEKKLPLDNMNNLFYKPKKKTNFRKVQIFNHFKPYLVDEFKEYGSYY